MAAPVKFLNADELKLAVMKSLSGRGMIEVDDRSNSLVVTDIPNRVNALVEMIQHLDSQTPQVEIVAKLVEVDARVSRSLGAFWGEERCLRMLREAGFGQVDVRQTTSDFTNNYYVASA